MPLLNKAGEVIAATTVTNAAEHTDVTHGKPLLPLAQWSPDSGAGLALAVDDEPVEEFAAAPLITVDFPVFNDGRGLSLAVLLRTRVGYTGELRAVGDVQPDMLHYLTRCGFDTFELPEHRSSTLADGSASLAPYSDYYQASVVEPRPAFRRVARGS